MEHRRLSETMASEWQTVFVVSQNAMVCLAHCCQELQQKSWKTARLFSSRPRPNVQDQDQDFMIQDQDFHFCPRGASRPRPWSRGLHHCYKRTHSSHIAMPAALSVGDMDGRIITRCIISRIWHATRAFWLHLVLLRLRMSYVIWDISFSTCIQQKNQNKCRQMQNFGKMHANVTRNAVTRCQNVPLKCFNFILLYPRFCWKSLQHSPDTLEETPTLALQTYVLILTHSPWPNLRALHHIPHPYIP